MPNSAAPASGALGGVGHQLLACSKSSFDAATTGAGALEGVGGQGGGVAPQAGVLQDAGCVGVLACMVLRVSMVLMSSGQGGAQGWGRAGRGARLGRHSAPGSPLLQTVQQAPPTRWKEQSSAAPVEQSSGTPSSVSPTEAAFAVMTLAACGIDGRDMGGARLLARTSMRQPVPA